MTHELDPYAETIFKRTYARWVESEQRRETFPEATDRYLKFFEEYLADNNGYTIPQTDIDDARKAILGLDVMPSMRAFMTAGPALKQAAIANYNCTAHGIEDMKSFCDLMYIMMCGSGSGFSVERRFTDKLPRIPYNLYFSTDAIVVEDSRIGWCEAFHEWLRSAFKGTLRPLDISGVRKEGERLKTFGGYASGGGVLLDLVAHCHAIFLKAEGRQLRPIEVFSICTMIAQIVVVGGVRRSATICLFDLDDEEMLYSKSGEWWAEGSGRQHYAMANISAVFEETPTRKQFDAYWKALKESFAGEPGIFNRAGIRKHLKANGRAIHYPDGSLIPFLANPCCEIILRPKQACNLTGVAVRPDDSLVGLEEKVRIATMLGTWQASVNHFEYLDQGWHDNINEECLLGVCLSGFYDHDILKGTSDHSTEMLQELKAAAIGWNAYYAGMLNIPKSASVTSVKPAGNSGELYGTASGIHPRFAKTFIRTVRVSRSDPVARFLQDQGVPVEVSAQNPRDLVFSFPRKGPKEAVTADEVSCLQQLDHWLHVKKNWTTHTVSATVYVREDEWGPASDWVYENFDEITGIAFLPFDNGNYQQAPIQRITDEEYEMAASVFPRIDWSQMHLYEQVDNTSPAQEFVCVGDRCMLTS
jgi:ribonucleoside-diphosphate reductase alpha chain